MELETRFTEEWPQFRKYKRLDDAWYIISEIIMNTHCGTHIEFPYHHVKDGQDAAEYPLSQLIGEGVVIDISAWRSNNSKITLSELKAAAADLIRPGDMVFSTPAMMPIIIQINSTTAPGSPPNASPGWRKSRASS